MPKATSLTPEALNLTPDNTIGRDKAAQQKADTDKIEPLQIRIPHSQVRR